MKLTANISCESKLIKYKYFKEEKIKKRKRVFQIYQVSPIDMKVPQVVSRNCQTLIYFLMLEKYQLAILLHEPTLGSKY